ncbi:SDR family NAD(P)-dependent oxidoreductase [Teredinibacter turnerae]|uniref:SDR family NAD(P)-dependent oxidoreductase n=1 Tax=Teredinibacter turnerae TaxID=2426 RepID=UPI000365BD19|nr:SDR family NAD(P)-dependent oxidoreductase [Teredinibacter turnerae]
MELVSHRIAFHQNLIDSFSEFSRDLNPMHLDEVYARKTSFATPICFGCLAVISSLAYIRSLHRYRIHNIKAEFLGAIAIGQEYSISGKQHSENKYSIRISDGSLPLLECVFVAEFIDNDQLFWQPRRSDSTEYDESATLVAVDSVSENDYAESRYPPRWDCFELLAENLGVVPTNLLANLSAVLGLFSYWIGMKLPGQQALFSGFSASLEPDFAGQIFDSLDVNARVTHVEKAFGMVRQELAIANHSQALASASLQALFRPESRGLNPLSLKLGDRVESHFSGKNIFITGASRGLGACIAAASLLAGARVYGNFYRSRDEVDKWLKLLPEHIRINFVPVQGDCQQAEPFSTLTNSLEESGAVLDYVFLSATPALEAMVLSKDSHERFSAYIEQSFKMVSAPLAALEDMIAADAQVVLISTVAVEAPVAAWPHYVAAKSGLEKLFEALALKKDLRRWCVVRFPQLATDLVYSVANRDALLLPEDAASQLLSALAEDNTAIAGNGNLKVISDFSVATSNPNESASSATISKGHDSTAAKNAEASLEQANSGGKPLKTIAFASSFTLDPIEHSFTRWSQNQKLFSALGGPIKLALAQYGQVVQTLLSPQSVFYQDGCELSIVLLRLEDAFHYHENYRDLVEGRNDEEAHRLVLGAVKQWCEAIAAYHGAAPLTVVLCPDSHAYSRTASYRELRASCVVQLRDCCSSAAAVYFREASEFHLELSPSLQNNTKARLTDPNLASRIEDVLRNEIAHIPYVDNYYDALVRGSIRQLCALRFTPKKVLVCDCDNTLWGGIVGEDGVEGISIDAGHSKLQHLLVNAVNSGFLVCLASKNNLEDVQAVFEQRKDMVLQAEHVTGWKVNWSPKSDNIRNLADELSLGLESFVFLDDNPAEILEVQQQLEAVLCIHIPAGEHLASFCNDFWFTDRLTITSEDRKRTAMYKGQVLREQEKSRQSSLLDYIEALDIRTQIIPLDDASVARVSQLCLKTNQFNFTTLRLDENAVKLYISEPEKYAYALHVQDKFGDYGLVGAIFLRTHNNTLHMDNMLLSCRVLGRGIEYQVLNFVGDLELEGFDDCSIDFKVSAKNTPAIDFLAKVFPDSNIENTDAGCVTTTRSKLAELRLTEEGESAQFGAGSGVTARSEKLASGAVVAQNIFYQSVLTQFSTEPQSALARPGKNSSQKNDGAKAVAEVWPILKSVIEDTLIQLDEPVTKKTSFDSLSLTSLMMVNLTVALARAFKTKLSSTYLYGLNTLADLDKKLQTDIYGQVDDLTPVVSVSLTAKEGSGDSFTPISSDSSKVRSLEPLLADSNEKIAIIGVAGRYPGASSIDELWGLVSKGECVVGEVPQERWPHSCIFSQENTGAGQTYSNYAAFISDVDKFDSRLFNISPKDAAIMDPQQRWFLTIAYECLLSAGYSRANLTSNTGVFVGAMARDYQALCAPLVAQGKVPFPYADLYQIANRVSYFLDLNGPSITVDTACSSSGVALHMAVDSIRKGECSQAFVGGVNLILHPQRHVQYAQMQMLSKDGRCRSFADDANGMVMGEGVGCLLLKPLSVAQQAGDNILGTVLSTHTNAGGRTTGFTVPNPVAQSDLIRQAIDKARISADSISYIEAHGTGTPLGDPIEVEGIGSALQRRADQEPCKLGSIKSNIGHLEPAAAIAGITKVLLQFQHKTLAPSLHVKALNHRIDFAAEGVEVQQHIADWLPISSSEPKRAGVSSFGAGGVNAHVILESYSPGDVNKVAALQPTYPSLNTIVPLSAQSDEALDALIKQMHAYISMHVDVNLSSIGYTLQTGRDEFRYRAAIVANSRESLLEQLEGWHDRKRHGAATESGDIKEYRDLGDIFSDCDVLVDQWLQQGHADKIAALWTKGAAIKWERLWSIDTSQPGSVRVRLPGYPFMGDRHWVEGAKWQPMEGTPHAASPAPVASGENIAVAHGEANKVALSISQYFVSDHVVDSRAILPGVSYLAAFESVLNDTDGVFAIDQMMWVRPLSFEHQNECILSAQQGGSHTALVDDLGTVYAKCQSFGVSDAAAPINLPRLLSDLRETISREECYQRLVDQGFNYGPGLRCVDKVQFKDNLILGRIIQQKTTAGDPWSLSSGLLDAGLQTTIIANNAPQTLLPYACDKIIVCSKRWPSRVFSVANLQHRSAQRITCELGFYDSQGNPLLVMQGLTLLASKSDTASQTEAVATGRLKPSDNHSRNVAASDFYCSQWTPVDRSQTAATDFNNVDVVVITHPLSSSKNVVERLAIACNGAPILEVPVSGKQIPQLPQLGKSKRLFVDCASPYLADVDFLPVLDVYRRYPSGTEYIVVASDSDTADVQALAQSYASFGRAMLHETDQFILKTFITGLAWETLFKDVLTAESSLAFKEVQGELYSLNYTSLDANAEQGSGQSIGFSVGGIYWLTGLGGVTEALAMQIQARYQAKIVITGRRAPETVSPLLDRLPGVNYIQADITNAAQCEDVFDWIKRNLGELSGVIHLAGTVHDDRLVNQTQESISRVLKPKITGAKNLLSKLNDCPNAWLILGSSIASVVGNIGQSNYAMANGFLDALAREALARGQDTLKETASLSAGADRIKTPVLSVSWPLWRNTGMAADKEDLVEHNQRFGFGYILPENGLAVLEQAMADASHSPHVIYLPGDGEKIARAFNISLPHSAVAAVMANTEHAPSAGDPSEAATGDVFVPNPVDVRAQLLENLFDHTNELLSLPEGVLEADEDLSSYGFDSISLSDFADRLNADYGLGISPVLFFDYPTLSGLADALLERFGEKIAKKMQLAAPATAFSQAGIPPLPRQQLSGESTVNQQPTHASVACEKTVGEVITTVVQRPENSSVTVSEGNSVPALSVALAAPGKTPASEQEFEERTVAIVGMAGRFPGADSLETFWQNLVSGVDMVTPVPQERFSNEARQYFAGLVDGLEQFDPEFFKITGREAVLMDPQHRLLMELAWQAVEHAGYHPKSLSGSATGVFVGITLHDHLQRLHDIGQQPVSHLATGNVHCLASNRISYLLNLNGPSESVDTACSSSLVAMNRAVKALRAGECTAALVGGVNALLSDVMFNAFTEAGMLSPTGRCHTFSANADGYVRGEGGGMVFIKTLHRALADKDPVLALIRGTAVNHGGHGQSLTAPSANAQAKVIQQALKDAQLSPDSISYVEAHGTGTQLGDPIELEGLTQVFGSAHVEHPRYTGTVKTNIGHLESAAGMAGLIKLVLALQHQILPKSLHGEPINNLVNTDTLPFEFLHETRSWGGDNGLPLRAGLSSFGFGGVNGHIVLEQAPSIDSLETAQTHPGSTELIIVSAVSESLLVEQLQNLQAIAASLAENQLATLAYTSRVARGSYKHRAAFLVSSLSQLQYQISQFISGAVVANLTETEITERPLKALIDEGAWAELGARWLQGLNIDWQAAGATALPMHRTPFPLTRFNRRDCSIELLGAKPTIASRDSEGEHRSDEKPVTKAVFYRPAWEPCPLESNAASIVPYTRTILLLVRDDESVLWHERIAQSPRHNWHIVRFSGLYPRLSKTELEIDLNAENPMAQFIQLLEHRHIRPDWVIDAFDFTATQEATASSGFWLQRVQLLQSCMRAWQGRGQNAGVHFWHLSGSNGSAQSSWFETLYAGLGVEYKNIQTHQLQLESCPVIREFEAVLEQEAMQPATQQSVSRRSGSRNVRQFEPITLSTNSSSVFLRSDAVYVVTGGTGGLGVVAAKLLISCGARQLILLGRKPLDEKGETVVRTLSEKGATVNYSSSVNDLKTRLQSERLFVAGVIHCAGVDTQGDLAFINKSSSSFEKCLLPKTELAQRLCEELRPHLDPAKLQFFIAYSSVSSVVPVLTAGRSDYGPANGALNSWIAAQAEHYSNSGFVSVLWPSHESGGMPVITSERYQNTGLACLTEDQADQFLRIIMQAAIQGRLHDVLLLPHLDISLPLNLFPQKSPSAMLAGVSEASNLKSEDIVSPATTDQPSTDSSDLLASLTTLFAEKLLIAQENLAAEASFSDLGIDSILIADLVRAIETKFECVMPPSAILEHPTLVQLADFLNEELGVNSLPKANQSLSSVATVPTPSREQVSTSVEHADKIAVIGMACRFPGAGSLTEFWQNLMQSVCSVTEVPDDRFDVESLFSKEQEQGKSISKWGGFVDGVDLFDPEFFSIPTEQAAYIDPLTRLSLLTSAEAIAHAGYSKNDVWGTRCGVYVGGNRSHYGLDHVSNAATATGLNQNFMAAHLAHVYNFTGPCYVMDAACTSSLLSIHNAARDLALGDIDMAIAGGVEVLLDQTPYLKLSAAGALSPDGLCQTFSKNANGFVPGEGAGMVVLKRLQDALRDNDTICAVVEASAVNNDGHTMGLTTPNLEAQKALLAGIYSAVPEAVAHLQYIEAHGTGTMIGDPIELKAMASILDGLQVPQGQVAVGSVKSNVGHLMGAAGVAAFIKTVLVVQNGFVPETLHCGAPNPRFNFERSPLVPANKPKTLANQDSIYAGISAFGFGGTNCHICVSNRATGRSGTRVSLPAPKFNLRRFWLESTGQTVTHKRASASAASVASSEGILALEWL